MLLWLQLPSLLILRKKVSRVEPIFVLNAIILNALNADGMLLQSMKITAFIAITSPIQYTSRSVLGVTLGIVLKARYLIKSNFLNKSMYQASNLTMEAMDQQVLLSQDSI